MKTSQKIYLPFKRLIGIFGSLVGIVFCSVLLWWWVITVNAIVTKGHPFFVHERYGRHLKVFKMIKFRSMKLDANPNLAPSDMDESTQSSVDTGFGKFLRKTHIDEFPQLLNVIVGQMLFVGTRPEVKQYQKEWYATLLMRPGITSTASYSYDDEAKDLVEGNADELYLSLVLPKKMVCNLEDIKKTNVFREIKIMWKTVF